MADENYMPPPHQNQGMTLAHMADSSSLLLNLELDLLGKVYDEHARQPIKIGEPLLNEAGVKYIIGEIRPIVDKNTTFSNIPEKRVGLICLLTANSIATTLFYKMEAYDVSKDNYDAICEKCNNIIEFSIRRAEKGGERGLFGKAVSEHVITENRTENIKGSGGLSLPKLF